MEQQTMLRLNGTWDEILRGEQRRALEETLPSHLMSVRWFGGKARTISGVHLEGAVPVQQENGRASSYITTIKVSYADGGAQTYVLPLTFATGSHAEQVRRNYPGAVLLEASVGGQEPGVLYDASWDKDFAAALLDAIDNGKRLAGPSGDITASSTRAYQPLHESANGNFEPSVMRAQQSNTSIVYGDTFILKLFRRLEEGVSPDLEIGRFLVDKGFKNTPPVAGALELQTADRGLRIDDTEPNPQSAAAQSSQGTRNPQSEELRTLAILQGFAPNKGDAWEYTLDCLCDYFEKYGTGGSVARGAIPEEQHLLDMTDVRTPEQMIEAIGSYLTSATLLGRRTAELHVTLASGEGDPAFKPEPFTMDYQRSLYDSMSGLADQAFELLRRRAGTLPAQSLQGARLLIEERGEVQSRFQPLLEREFGAMRSRCHGDYHLGQVLVTKGVGDPVLGAGGEHPAPNTQHLHDFLIIDFEGEPVRSLKERRQKQSPLKDVAGMLRSFHYAAYAALFDQIAEGPLDVEQRGQLEVWADAWHTWVSAAYLKEYLKVASQSDFLPGSRQELRRLLDLYILEKAVYELVYELNNRPGWVRIPLQGIMQLLA